MIRVRRPPVAPPVLSTKGAAARTSDCDAFAKGHTTFAFDKKIYGHESVKKTLVKAQHDKCCFCESKIAHVSFGHIEHFRPKGGVRQRKTDPLRTPGYFWLAYEWTNLLFSCEVCNSRHKANLFPLRNPSKRARKPSDPIDREAPLFVDPSTEDPELHLDYREEYPYAVGGSARGEATWRGLGLDRAALAEVRRDLLMIVRTLKAVRDARDTSAALRTQAAAFLTALAGDDKPWAAMVRAEIRRP